MRPAILQSQHNHTGVSSARRGISGNEIPLDGLEVGDIFNMYHGEPIFKMSEKAFLSKVLRKAFTLQIPKLGMVNNQEVAIIIKSYWMEWLRTQFRWEKILGITPVMLVPLEENPEHLVPYTPRPTDGFITVYREAKKPFKTRYKWYWNNTQVNEEEKRMLWVISENAPDATGRLMSPMVSLLSMYRSMVKLRTAQDIASTQCAKPVHIIERNPSLKTAVDDGLARHAANWDKAAGIGKARRERMQQSEMRVRQKELHRNLRMMDEANRQQSTTTQTLWTDTPQKMLEEMDAGFSNRVVTLEDHNKYVQAARPQLVADYNKAEAQFNMMAASVMDFALELLTPTGTARSQNIQGAEQYETDRIREQTTRYETILRPLIIISYGKKLREIIDGANRWMLSRLKGDVLKADMLYPDVDIVIDLSNTIVTSDEEMISYWMHGFISQKTCAEHILRNKNIPLENMQLSAWPDNFPKERLVKTQGGGGEKRERPKKQKDEGGEESASRSKKAKSSSKEKKEKSMPPHTKKKDVDNEVEKEVSNSSKSSKEGGGDE